MLLAHGALRLSFNRGHLEVLSFRHWGLLFHLYLSFWLLSGLFNADGQLADIRLQWRSMVVLLLLLITLLNIHRFLCNTKYIADLTKLRFKRLLNHIVLLFLGYTLFNLLTVIIIVFMFDGFIDDGIRLLLLRVLDFYCVGKVRIISWRWSWWVNIWSLHLLNLRWLRIMRVAHLIQVINLLVLFFTFFVVRDRVLIKLLLIWRTHLKLR